MIRSFRCADTEELFTAGQNRQWSQMAAAATRQLAMLNEAIELRDLKSPPGNRLEQLERDRKASTAFE